MAALQLVPRVSLSKILFTTDFSVHADRALYAVGLERHKVICHATCPVLTVRAGPQ